MGGVSLPGIILIGVGACFLCHPHSQEGTHIVGTRNSTSSLGQILTKMSGHSSDVWTHLPGSVWNPETLPYPKFSLPWGPPCPGPIHHHSSFERTTVQLSDPLPHTEIRYCFFSCIVLSWSFPPCHQSICKDTNDCLILLYMDHILLNSFLMGRQ